MEAELEAERQGAEEEQQRAREVIERQKAELQKLEEERHARVRALSRAQGGGRGGMFGWVGGNRRFMRPCNLPTSVLTWCCSPACFFKRAPVSSSDSYVQSVTASCRTSIRLTGLCAVQEAAVKAKAEEEERRAAEQRFEELQRKMREAEERCAAIEQRLSSD